MFEFTLAALNQIEPCGNPPDLTLHWFGLTDGSYFIDLGHTHLLEYSSALNLPIHVEYQVARLHEDLLEMLPDVLASVPAGLLRGFKDGSLAATLADLRREWTESEEEPREELSEATETLGCRQLDTGYLSPSSGIWFWRTGEQVVVEWDNRGRLFQGAPAWRATVGRHEIPVSTFIEKVSMFHRRLMSAMASRIDEIAAGWARPEVKVSLDQLRTEQSQREPQLDRVLRSTERDQNWSAVEAALSAKGASKRGSDG